MKTQLMIAVTALTISLATYADNGMDHSKMDHSKMDHSQMQGMDHSKMDHSKMTPKQKEAMHKSMEAEMLKIINTVDINERKKLFAAHKKSMQAMRKAMQGNCSAKK